MGEGTGVEVGVIFDGSFDGFLTVVYRYYYDKIRPKEIVAGDMFQQTIGTEYVNIETNTVCAQKALAGIKEKLNDDIFGRICMAFVNCDTERFIHIFRYIVYCFKYGKDADGFTQIDSVMKTHLYAKNSGKELHLLKGFTRFAETKQGILYADISPDNDIMPMLADFFSDRLMGEKWVIHDLLRAKAAIYNGSDWIITDAPERMANISADTTEDYYQDLWAVFYNSIAIKERTNPKLQKALKPKIFWKHMTEHRTIADKEKYRMIEQKKNEIEYNNSV